MKFKASPVANPVSVAVSPTCPGDRAGTGLGMDGVPTQTASGKGRTGVQPSASSADPAHSNLNNAAGAPSNGAPADRLVG